MGVSNTPIYIAVILISGGENFGLGNHSVDIIMLTFIWGVQRTLYRLSFISQPGPIYYDFEKKRL
jgi:hypothetical protein